MERIRVLILKLLEQSHTNADAASMLATVNILQAELTALSAPATKQYGTAKVSVVMPSRNHINYHVRENSAPPVAEPKTEPLHIKQKDIEEVQKAPVEETVTEPVEEIKVEPVQQIPEAPVVQIIDDSLEEPEDTPEKLTYTLLEEESGSMDSPDTSPEESPEETTVFNAKIETNSDHEKYMPQDRIAWAFDQVREVPTLAHQTEFKEMNDLFGQQASSSLNDKLKSEKTELASVLKEGPVRDLKKAIGVNDRFVFVNELFRGDEPMYERSLKTINNFRIYPEAEYWIERELKVKLGWDENKDAVKQFRHLVKRRFS